jgi:hypothetical protein
MCLNSRPFGGTDALSTIAANYRGRNGLGDGQPVDTSRCSRGSARRKLWDLSAAAACPVTGVCLRCEDLKRLTRQAGLEDTGSSEYELHVAVVAACRKRTPLAERVQKELDQRYNLHVSASLKLKSDEALAQWWDRCCMETDWAGVFWAVLTHPRCGPELEFVVLGQVHMLQHQVGMAARVDQTRLSVLQAENQRMAQALEAAQQRLQALTQAHAQELARRDAERTALQAACTRLGVEHDKSVRKLQDLQRQQPALEQLQSLAQERDHMLEDNRQLRRALLRSDTTRDPLPTEGPEPHGVVSQGSPRTVADPGPEVDLCVRNRAVLCVGGLARVVPIYREVVESEGARFMHHDGGTEDKVSQLGGLLQAADLVVCQVGCVSHNAYWRVKAHCKRHNKPCLFIETPSRAAIERALRGQAGRLNGSALGEAMADQDTTRT